MRGQCGCEIDLHQAIRHQSPGHAHRRSARWLVGEEFVPNFVEGVEVTQVRLEHMRLDNMIERGAGCLEAARELLEDVTGLPLDARPVVREGGIDPRFGGDAACAAVARDLPGGEDEMAGLRRSHDGCFRSHETSAHRTDAPPRRLQPALPSRSSPRPGTPR